MGTREILREFTQQSRPFNDVFFNYNQKNENWSFACHGCAAIVLPTQQFQQHPCRCLPASDENKENLKSYTSVRLDAPSTSIYGSKFERDTIEGLLRRVKKDKESQKIEQLCCFKDDDNYTEAPICGNPCLECSNHFANAFHAAKDHSVNSTNRTQKSETFEEVPAEFIHSDVQQIAEDLKQVTPVNGDTQCYPATEFCLEVLDDREKTAIEVLTELMRRNQM